MTTDGCFRRELNRPSAVRVGLRQLLQRVQTAMREQTGYCWEKAAECAARADEAADKETRELFIRFRNWWINAANRYQSTDAGAAGKRVNSRLSFSPELGTSAWHKRPSEELTSTRAERLGAA
jgi:hypothetical protein